MTLPSASACARRKAAWGPGHLPGFLFFVLLFAASASPARAAAGHNHSGQNAGRSRDHARGRDYKLDDELTVRATRHNPRATTRAIVTLVPGAKLPSDFRKYSAGRGLGIINGHVLDVPNGVLKQLAAHPSVFRVHYDRPTEAHNYRTSLATGTRYVRQMLGYNGAGVGVAVIDSGVTSWHDDLTVPSTSTTQYPFGNQRVAAFVDFVNGRTQPYDDNGHGTHIAGTILGNGRDSAGTKAGMAPAASLVSLKVLDANGNGTISQIIAALDWVLANHDRYNIRVVNMSVGAAIHESYATDPLTLAAKRVVDAGVVVVAAAGNIGKNAAGQTQYGGITAPGNAPWVLTVGASSTNGTISRRDDTIASFSSRGPTDIDYAAKPDLVAPGMGTASLAAPESQFYASKSKYLVSGSIATANKPYLVLSGTSMAAPVVAGTVALMLQANPALTPNAVKAILEYTAQVYPSYNPLTQGAGFLNAVGAIRLARFFATAQPGAKVPSESMWGKRIIWGNHLLGGGYLVPSANAWQADTTWGAVQTVAGDNIVWGESCGAAGCDNIVWGGSVSDNIVWGDSCADASCDNIVWGGSVSDNIVWGEDCGGADCDNIVWGSVDPVDNIVWGSAAPGDNIVWGSTVPVSNIVWGSSDEDNIVWGSSDGGDNIVWGSSDGDNIVWGSSDDDNIVWGSSDGDNIVWGNSADEPVIWNNPTLGWFWTGFGSRLFDVLSDAKIFGFTSFVAQPAPAPSTSTTQSSTDTSLDSASSYPTTTLTTTAEFLSSASAGAF